MRRAVELLSSGALDVASLVTHRFPLAEIDAELKTTTDRILDMIKGLSA